MSDPRRDIPGVDALLTSEGFSALLARYGRERVVQAARAAVGAVRDSVAAGQPVPGLDEASWYVAHATELLARSDVPSLRRVINATGVVLHTNLGRAPLADVAARAVEVAARTYSNLEYDIEEGVRGSRYDHCVTLLRELTGAEDALVVNNNAAALVLALNTVALGVGVAVSRGELVEIGGGFRIPDILERSGARLVEVGSTNRTRVQDYREALEAGGVSAILKVHRSNFRITGFTEDAALADLVALAREFDVTLVHDLGSGLLVEADLLGLPDEPRAAGSIAAGADVVAVSGDKLLGGPQAGLLLGRSELVAALRSNPLCRALRVDKMTLAALEATLRLYRDGAAALQHIPTLRMLAAGTHELRDRARALVEALRRDGVDAAVADGEGAVGGGTYPGVGLSGPTVVLPAADASAKELSARLRRADPPVIARIVDDRVVIDARTVLLEEDEELAAAIVEAFRGQEGR